MFKLRPSDRVLNFHKRWNSLLSWFGSLCFGSQFFNSLLSLLVTLRSLLADGEEGSSYDLVTGLLSLGHLVTLQICQ